MDFGQKDKARPWHARWQGRLWLAVSVPAWLVGLLLPLFRWEGPPPDGLFFRECHLPDILPLTSRPQPPISYCEARRDARAEYAALKRDRLKYGEALRSALRSRQHAVDAPPSDADFDEPSPSSKDEGSLSQRSMPERREIEQSFRRYRFEVSQRYEVAECHLDGTCDQVATKQPYTDDLSYMRVRDEFWREPCGDSERAAQRVRHEDALRRCAAVKANPQKQKDAAAALMYERLSWAISLLMPTLLLLALPFALAGSVTLLGAIFGWIRRGSG